MRMATECSGDYNLADANDRYLAGGLLSYLGFILAILSLAGYGLGDDYKVAKILLMILTTACAVIGVFVIAKLDSSSTKCVEAVGPPKTCTCSYTASQIGPVNAIGIATTVYIWFLAVMAVLSGNKELAAGVGVVFGAYQFFALSSLLEFSDDYDTTFDELDKARAGWVRG